MQTFKPDQLVLVRECDTADWELARYSHCCTDGSNGHIHHEQGRRWFKDDEILPYSGNEHLLGTTDSPTPKWEPKPGELVAVRDSISECWVARVFYGKSSSSDFPFRCNTEDRDRILDWVYCEPLRKHFTIPEE